MKKHIFHMTPGTVIVDTGFTAMMVLVPNNQPRYYVGREYLGQAGIDRAVRDYLISKNYRVEDFDTILILDHDWYKERSFNHD